MATEATLTDGSRDCPEGLKASVLVAGDAGTVVGVGGRCPSWKEKLTPAGDDGQYRPPGMFEPEGSREGNHGGVKGLTAERGDCCSRRAYPSRVCCKAVVDDGRRESKQERGGQGF